MKLRPLDAAKYAGLFFPIYVGLGVLYFQAFDALPWPHDDWPDFWFKAIISTIIFSLVMTAYRKPK